MPPLPGALHKSRFFVVLGLTALSAAAHVARAQSPTFLDVGSDQERYDRILQITGYASLYPWTARGFSPAERDRLAAADTGNPWSGGLDRELKAGNLGPVRWAVLPVQSTVYFNSAFPYGFNDGAVWQGRGFTGALQGGVAARWGHVSLQLEPMVFDAQNSAFALMANGQTGQGVYANGFHPTNIDLPQRFGPGQYRRFDPGQSTLRVDLWPVAVGFSSANEFWGPAIYGPLILGNNAAGFPHVFIGTAHPLDLWVGHVYGRVIYGRLEQSAYAPDTHFGASRFGSGLVGEFTPRGMPGLEIGASRFFHTPWPQGGLSLSDLKHPFEGLLKQSLATRANPTGNDPGDNQLASVFFRWALPKSGAEIYGEYGREDHNVNARDLWEELDHDAAYTIGVQRVWRRSASRWYVASAEILNSRISHLVQGRPQANWYVHSPTAQGHTEYGQVLGAQGAFGGGAARLQVDRYDKDGRWSLSLSRLMRGERGGSNRVPAPDEADVLQGLGIERLIRRGHSEFTVGVEPVLDVNRDFSRNQSNINLYFAARAMW